VSLDTVAIAFDVLALGAVLVFTCLCLILSRGLSGSGLRRGFVIAAVAGFVQVTGSSMQFIVDLGFVGSRLPTTVFSGVQVLFLILMAFAVQSFFPEWFKSFRKEPNPSHSREEPHFQQPSPTPSPSQDVPARP